TFGLATQSEHLRGIPNISRSWDVRNVARIPPQGKYVSVGGKPHKRINFNGHVSAHWEAKSLGLPSHNGIVIRLGSNLAMNRGHYQAVTLPSIESCAQA